VVELRFFTGLSVSEAAEVLGVSKRTVDLDWRMARAWLSQALSESDRFS
jgi:DNA-directed RNA polymerase specialized sigma24 family protein